MNNEYKLLCCPFCGELPVITKHHREEMYAFMHRCEVLGPIGRDFREDPMSHVEMWNTRAAAAPQPPALGGEPERLTVSFEDHKVGQAALLEHIEVLKKQLQESKAHLAPLQAKISRMNIQFDELAAAVGFTKTRCEQAGDSPLDCANQLQAEIEHLRAGGALIVQHMNELKAEVEALRKDAERWRFFSLLANDLQAFPHAWGKMTPEKMDAMCDQAMADAALSKPVGSEQV
ncbi:hypothetical protein [Pseudomonas syringae group genomosp. 3]|uniref:hypothetical protein n=1 Tax=Pseudomonas syringae group genomosp. 3 TaxID=251701 RepID=UPI0001E28586|nr:hypothetical protein [Pseudomonas syringae group genomosp. 3]